MWDDDQLNKAKYVQFCDPETNQCYNVGTIEIGTGANQGIYLMRPAPPYGGLGAETPYGSQNAAWAMGVSLPGKAVSVQYGPRAFPVMSSTPGDVYTAIHDFGKPNL